MQNIPWQAVVRLMKSLSCVVTREKADATEVRVGLYFHSARPRFLSNAL